MPKGTSDRTHRSFRKELSKLQDGFLKESLNLEEPLKDYFLNIVILKKNREDLLKQPLEGQKLNPLFFFFENTLEEILKKCLENFHMRFVNKISNEHLRVF